MSSLADRPNARHLPLPETRPRMAKCDLRKAEKDEWVQLGRAVTRTRRLCGLSLKEFAAAVKRDERQVARWVAGTERTQVDAIFLVVKFRSPFVIALAELAGDGVEVQTSIVIKRTA